MTVPRDLGNLQYNVWILLNHDCGEKHTFVFMASSDLLWKYHGIKGVKFFSRVPLELTKKLEGVHLHGI